MSLEDPIYRELMNYAMRALSRRAHTVHEMREKLMKRPHHTPEHEEQIVSRLMELNLLNDEAYIRHIIENAVNFRFQGRLKVTEKLYLKGIPSKKTNEIWNSMKINERQLAQAALKKAEKRFIRVPKKKQFNKKAQFLASRGFPANIVFDLAKSA